MRRIEKLGDNEAVRSRASRLDVWCRAGLEISAGVGYAAFLLVEARQPSTGGALHELAFWLAVTALILLPLFPTTLERLFTRRPFGERGQQVFWLVQVAPLGLLGLDTPVHIVLGSMALLQGNLLVRASDDKLAAWSLVLAPCMVLAGWALEPAPEWLALFPLSLLVTGAALTLVRARGVERDLRERAPRLLFRVAEQPRSGSPREWSQRALASIPLALAILLGVPIAYAFVMATRAPLVSLWDQDPASRRERERERQRQAAARGAASGEGEERRRFPGELTYGGEVTQLAGHAVMEIRPYRDGRVVHPPPLYMRGLVLDVFAADGAQFGGGIQRPLFEVAEGGWTRLAPAAARTLELEVLLEPMFLSGDWSNVLFSPQPTTAVDFGSVRFHPDDRLTLTVRPQETIRYRLETAWPRDPRASPPRGNATHSDPRYLQLPTGAEELPRIAERAREALGNTGSDAERVQRLMEHFRAGYAYSLESREITGLAAVVDFLQRRQGHCTYFAVAAVLMLRSQGIPARVATGYLASDWSEDEDFFRVTTRNGHAWIEVHFEDEGWVTYDPTPPERRAAAWAAADADPDGGLMNWLTELRESVVFWATTGGHEAYLRAFLQTLKDGPRALLSTLKRQPGWIALFGALVVIAWARRRSRRAAARSTHEAGPAPFRDELHRLLTALAARGFPRRPSQTLRELALDATAQGGEPYLRLPVLTRALQRARYGSPPLSAAERHDLEAFLHDLPSRDD